MFNWKSTINDPFQQTAERQVGTTMRAIGMFLKPCFCYKAALFFVRHQNQHGSLMQQQVLRNLTRHTCFYYLDIRSSSAEAYSSVKLTSFALASWNTWACM